MKGMTITMARLSKSDEALIEEFDLAFEEIPEVSHSRRSRYDGVWEAAATLCRKNPGKSLRTRLYNGSSGAYQEATKINNGEHKVFVNDEDGTWEAQPAPTGEYGVTAKGNEAPQYALYVTFHSA